MSIDRVSVSIQTMKQCKYFVSALCNASGNLGLLPLGFPDWTYPCYVVKQQKEGGIYFENLDTSPENFRAPEILQLARESFALIAQSKEKIAQEDYKKLLSKLARGLLVFERRINVFRPSKILESLFFYLFPYYSLVPKISELRRDIQKTQDEIPVQRSLTEQEKEEERSRKAQEKKKFCREITPRTLEQEREKFLSGCLSREEVSVFREEIRAWAKTQREKFAEQPWQSFFKVTQVIWRAEYNVYKDIERKLVFLSVYEQLGRKEKELERERDVFSRKLRERWGFIFLWFWLIRHPMCVVAGLEQYKIQPINEEMRNLSARISALLKRAREIEDEFFATMGRVMDPQKTVLVEEKDLAEATRLAGQNQNLLALITRLEQASKDRKLENVFSLEKFPEEQAEFEQKARALCAQVHPDRYFKDTDNYQAATKLFSIVQNLKDRVLEEQYHQNKTVTLST